MRKGKKRNEQLYFVFFKQDPFVSGFIAMAVSLIEETRWFAISTKVLKLRESSNPIMYLGTHLHIASIFSGKNYNFIKRDEMMHRMMI